MIFPIRVAVNVNIDFSTGFLRHDVIVPGTPPVKLPAPVPSMEMIATQFWPPGVAGGKHKFSSQVVHRGFPIALDGHDCGPFIPDITPPQPANLQYLIMWPTSSRKFILSSASVEHDGQKVACAQMLLVPIPMQTCGDPLSLPAAMINLNMFNTEHVGVTLAEFLVGMANLVVGILIDLVFHKLSGGSSESKKLDDFAGHVMTELWKSWGTPLDAKGWLKWEVKVLAGFALSFLDTEAGEFTWRRGTMKGELMGTTVSVDRNEPRGERVSVDRDPLAQSLADQNAFLTGLQPL